MDRAEVIGRLRAGAHEWNEWRRSSGYARITLAKQDLRGVLLKCFDLRGVDLDGARLTGADLRHAVLAKVNLRGADIRWTRLYAADLREACMDDVQAQGADFRKANLHRAWLRDAHLRDATFREADLSRAHLERADLTNAVFVETDLAEATLIGCRVYGCAAWRPKLRATTQRDLIVTPLGDVDVLVNDLLSAQVVHMLIDNRNVRAILDAVSTSAVLILGRFTPTRKPFLDKLAVELRRAGRVPILFDFQPSKYRDLTETIGILASLAQFVVADLTEASSVPQELSAIVPAMPSVTVLPILAKGYQPYALFEHWRRYPNVHDIRYYEEATFDPSAMVRALLEDVDVNLDVRALQAELRKERHARVAAEAALRQATDKPETSLMPSAEARGKEP